MKESSTVYVGLDVHKDTWVPKIETSKGYVDGKTARSHVSTDRVLKGKITP